MAEKTFPEIQGITGTVKRAKAEGALVSEYTLRRAIRSGAIPCRRVGRTYLIAWPNVKRWLLCENGADNAPRVVPGVGGIRQVEVSSCR